MLNVINIGKPLSTYTVMGMQWEAIAVDLGVFIWSPNGKMTANNC